MGCVMDEMTMDTSIYPNGTIVADRYKIESFLAQGGMAQVYVATQQQINRLVALKVLSPMFSMNPGVVMRFFREAHVIGSLVHPNTVRIYDMGETPDKRMFIAMELLKGEELSERIKRGPMTPAEALPIVRQVAGSLSEAHQLGIIHRDLKPDNIFLTSMNVVKVLDFGIAKLKSDDSKEGGKKLTKAGTAPGTPEYMSPEQARGKELDARADLYSLGVVLYEMLKGEPPFEEATFLGTILMHIQAPPPPLPESVPLPLRNYVINRLLAKDPNSRPASAEVFIEEIDQLSRKLGLSGEDDSAKLKAEIESLKSEILMLKSGDTNALTEADVMGDSQSGAGGRKLEIAENIKVSAPRGMSEKQQSMVRDSGSSGAVPPKMHPRMRAAAVPPRAAMHGGSGEMSGRDGGSSVLPAVGQAQVAEEPGLSGLRGQPLPPMPLYEESGISGARGQSAPSLSPVPGSGRSSNMPGVPKNVSKPSGMLGGPAPMSMPAGMAGQGSGVEPGISGMPSRAGGMPEIPGTGRMPSGTNMPAAMSANVPKGAMPGMPNRPNGSGSNSSIPPAVAGLGVAGQAGMMPGQMAPGMMPGQMAPGQIAPGQMAPGQMAPNMMNMQPMQPNMPYGTMVNMPAPGYMNGMMPGGQMYNGSPMGMPQGGMMPGSPNMPAGAPGPRMTQQGMAVPMGGMQPGAEEGDFIPYPRHMQSQMNVAGMPGNGMPMSAMPQQMGGMMPQQMGGMMPQQMGGMMPQPAAGGFERQQFKRKTAITDTRKLGDVENIDLDRTSALSRPIDVMTGRATRHAGGSRDMKFMMFVQPLMQKVGKDKLSVTLDLAKDIWNAVLYGPEAVSAMYHQAKGSPNLQNLLHLMVDRKRECYPDERWEIVDYELEEQIDDKGNKRVGIQLETRDI